MKVVARNGSPGLTSTDAPGPVRRRDGRRAASPGPIPAGYDPQGQGPASPIAGPAASPTRTWLRDPAPPVPAGGRSSQQRPSTTAYARGAEIFRPGTGDGLVYIIRSGCIRLYKTLSDGRSINVGLLGPNTIFAQEDSGDGMASGATAEAVVPSTLSIVEAQDLANLISDSPELASAVVSGMTRRLTELQTLVEHLLVRDTSVRLSVTLLNLAAKFGRPAVDGLQEITLPLTHQGLANMIGSNRVTVTRKLLELQRDGTVRSLGRNIIAVDTARLQAHAAGNPGLRASAD
ncbi:MAG: cAMP-binding proteins - catabolite gene activator and regulatory subunit of cAMP-dependent protein kinases [uncultured Thermomicrobiales bacterium]|uniref:cAMP-binding proteins - catabolite gene activator and regulatory subunit of cAMP-dependent protein kinases n=1 Tax=uncultured Thermomicrobiales bacterium TaxID=1645740 RepID=A0A6J4VGA7_9BACT|nr:MAG: cAMP-binding proteins - catabolite gene activator and regulatory subunit of cAMP-dependent protein kinases [uncultured Thermomicrobiales bacterium]